MLLGHTLSHTHSALALKAAAVACFLLAGCAASADSTDTAGSDIVDPANSSIRSADIGTVTEVKLLPNTNVPRAAIVQLSDLKFVADLYDHVISVNEAERLHGADGYEQQINLIVAGPAARYDALLRTIRQRRGLSANAPIPLLNPIDGVADQDIWMQDFGEFTVVRGSNDPTRQYYGVLDSNRGRGIDVARLGAILGTPVTKIQTPMSAGTYGGNTEATAEGKLYLGDKAPSQFFSALRNLGNPDAIMLPSNWLLVGHVDEYLTLVPAQNDCHAAYMMASGLEALNLARHNPAEYTSQGDVLATGQVGAALDAYALRRRPANEDYVFSDFDLTRRPTTSAEAFVQLNLQAEGYALEAMRRLKQGACAEFIRVPQFFTAVQGKAIALNPGTVNSLVLRNHAIVPDPNSAELRAIVKSRYAQALGSEDNVHYIDDHIYHTADGEVHCGTNVIRDIHTPYRF